MLAPAQQLYGRPILSRPLFFGQGRDKVVDADDLAELRIVDVVCLLHIRRDEAEHLAIDIIDGGPKEQQRADHPAVALRSRGRSRGRVVSKRKLRD